MSGNYRKCAMCKKKWNVSVYDKRKEYICPHCEQKKDGEKWRSNLKEERLSN